MLSEYDIRYLLGQHGSYPATVLAADAAYQEMTKSWLLNDFKKWFNEVKHAIGFVYTPEASDCDDFAVLYSALARLCHAKTRPGGGALAIGPIWYQSNAGPHAIVVAFTDEGIVFVEPQTGDSLELTDLERASIHTVFL